MIGRDFWRSRRVFVTGHTGFKGAWLCLLLRRLGAEVYGFALPPDDERGIFVAAGVADDIHHCVGDIRELAALAAAIEAARPSIVMHLAAQSLVRLSYAEPVTTYATNVMGTVHVVEAVRRTPGIDAAVVVTSDKCYENTGANAGYVETDRLGGHDPYSNSKAAAELVSDAYRRSFLYDARSPKLATARAGNVIGGGDWAADRLVPDAMRAFASGRPLPIRHPHAVRPWQHVFDPLLGYLALAERLVGGGAAFAQAWNFGPAAETEVPVAVVATRLAALWGDGARWEQGKTDHLHEAQMLRLDCAKAHSRLGWRPQLDLDDALRLSVEWYAAQHRGKDMRRFSLDQLGTVLKDAVADGAPAWQHTAG